MSFKKFSSLCAQSMTWSCFCATRASFCVAMWYAFAISGSTALDGMRREVVVIFVVEIVVVVVVVVVVALFGVLPAVDNKRCCVVVLPAADRVAVPSCCFAGVV